LAKDERGSENQCYLLYCSSGSENPTPKGAGQVAGDSDGSSYNVRFDTSDWEFSALRASNDKGVGRYFLYCSNEVRTPASVSVSMSRSSRAVALER